MKKRGKLDVREKVINRITIPTDVSHLSVLDYILIVGILGGVIFIAYAKDYIKGAIFLIIGLVILLLYFIFRKKRKILFTGF